jgi:hypothetical protein
MNFTAGMGAVLRLNECSAASAGKIRLRFSS